MASSYLQGAADAEEAHELASMTVGERGAFTLLIRPTRPEWPGSIIAYFADGLEREPGKGRVDWSLVVTHDGRARDHADFCAEILGD